jgi:hypothetical protein
MRPKEVVVRGRDQGTVCTLRSWCCSSTESVQPLFRHTQRWFATNRGCTVLEMATLDAGNNPICSLQCQQEISPFACVVAMHLRIDEDVPQFSCYFGQLRTLHKLHRLPRLQTSHVRSRGASCGQSTRHGVIKNWESHGFSHPTAPWPARRSDQTRELRVRIVCRDREHGVHHLTAFGPSSAGLRYRTVP